MNSVHPLVRAGGPILGLLILIYVINAGVDTFRADLKAARDAEREAILAAAETESEQEAEETTTAEAPSQDEEVQEESALPEVFFRQPTTHAIVPPTFVVKMGAVGVSVDPSGDVVAGSGHMHILVDTDFIPAGEIIPTDDQHLHYGDASLETELTLTPGEHTLHLQFADGLHTALEGDQYRDTIIVFVEEDAADQSVAFFDPLDGTTVSSPVEVTMTATGLIVEPSGEVNDDAGHFHILVDTDFITAGEIIPTDEKHLHYGQGQTSVSLELEPGEHTLRLQFADGLHTALDGDQYRDTITIVVEASDESPSVRFGIPADGETVTSPFAVAMQATGLIVEPSGEVNEGAGHFHILVNTDFTPAGEIIPTDDQHLHYGQGQTIATLELEPGEHTLRLQFADGLHTALDGDQYRDTITVSVEASDESPSVRFGLPADGATVTSPFEVAMLATGLIVEPSGEVNEGAGHFHILVNTDFTPAGEIIPTDDRHLHYGQGQTTATLELEPGEHTLRLQFADGLHTALDGDQYRDTITVLVEASNQSPSVQFEQPADGATVTSPFDVAMLATGLIVEPSGEVNEGAGHFHILVNTDFTPAGEIIPTDDLHLHYGQGQTTATLELEPGGHTLRLQFADGLHTALEGDQYRDTITVFVAAGDQSPAVRFEQPADGATVTSPFEVVMAATGLVVEPSGEVNEGAGHFHILVDTDFTPAGEVIPTDELHLHYGQGQTTATLELEPGEYTLRLQFADGLHTALEGDQFRDTITVVVEAAEQSPSVRFEQPADGATVTSPFEVVMEATGLVVEPSGEVNVGAGHFHILVNTDFTPAGEVIPTDEENLHYGQGQTTATLELEPGEYTLRLQFADGLHTALEGDLYRDTITVIVEEAQSTGEGPSDSDLLAQETVDLAIEAMTRTGCNSCHVTTGLPVVDAAMLGPDQTNLGAIAGSRREGYSAEEYLREAILDPSAFIVEECPLGQCLQVMPVNYGDLLTEEELDAVVAYLLSLTTEE